MGTRGGAVVGIVRHGFGGGKGDSVNSIGGGQGWGVKVK